MIKKETALAFIKRIPPDEVAKFAFYRITGKDRKPAGDARLDEPMEDVLIQVLKSEPKESQLSKSIIMGCMKVYHFIEETLSLGDPSELNGDFISVA